MEWVTVSQHQYFECELQMDVSLRMSRSVALEDAT